MKKLSKEQIAEINKSGEKAKINGLQVFDDEEDIDWGKVDPEQKWHLKFENKNFINTIPIPMARCMREK